MNLHKQVILYLQSIYPQVDGFNRQKYIDIIKKKNTKSIRHDYLLFLLQTDLVEETYAKKYEAIFVDIKEVVVAYIYHLLYNKNIPLGLSNYINIIETYTGHTVDLRQYKQCYNLISKAYSIYYKEKIYKLKSSTKLTV
jgi:hypothetical protein